MSDILSATEFAAVMDDYDFALADGNGEVAAECWQTLKKHDEAFRAAVESLLAKSTELHEGALMIQKDRDAIAARLRDAEEALRECVRMQTWDPAVDYDARHAADKSTGVGSETSALSNARVSEHGEVSPTPVVKSPNPHTQRPCPECSNEPEVPDFFSGEE